MGLLAILFGKKKAEEKRFTITKINDLSDGNKAILKQQYKSLENDLDKIWEQARDRKRKQVDETNSKCPKCGSLKVNNRIKRVEGEIHGSSSISGSSSLFGGSLYGSGRIDGKLDTNPVNKCNDCQNEWQIAKNDYSYGRKTMEDLAEAACTFLDKCHEAYYGDVKFDPNNLKETFASEEDKRKALIEEISKYWRGVMVRDYFSKYSIELIQYIVDSELGVKNGSNVYYYSMWEKGDKSMLTKILGIPSIIK